MKALRVFAPVILSLTAILSAAELTVPPAPPADSKPNIAVITLKNASGVQAGETEIISDRLRAELFNTGRVNVMERDQMQEILKEQGFQASGACTDEACLVEMGQLLGVSRLITGSMGKLGSMFMLNLRAIDVKTGRISKAVSKDISGGIEEVVDYLPDIARELTGGDAKSAPAPVVKEVKKEEPKVEEKAPEPAVEEVKEEEVKEEEEEPKPVGPEELREVDEKKERNRNRAGVHLGLNLFGGMYQHTVFREFSYSYYDTTTEYEVKDADFAKVDHGAFWSPELMFLIKAGPFLTVDIGGSYESNLAVYHLEPYYDTTTTYDHKISIGSFKLGLNFVKRFFPAPLKLNAGMGGSLSILVFRQSVKQVSTYWGFEETIVDTAFFDVAFGGQFGMRAGLEVLAGAHVGFPIDLLVRFGSFSTVPEESYDYNSSVSDYYTLMFHREFLLPIIGLGLGVNFYF